ncbi:MAG TPA: hypothetical protein VG963_02615 [Polyangiaceae bacterium]|nr:hypothetical protein [Polyangiaceae bacterium]
MTRASALQRLTGIGLSLALVTCNAGCGALFNSSIATVPISVSPAVKAKIFVDGTLAGEAPVNVRLTTYNAHTVSVEAAGYAHQTVRIESHAGGGYIAADCVLLVVFLVPGIIALAVDGGSGDWNVLDPDQVTFQLPASRAVPSPDTASGVQSASKAAPTGCQDGAQCKQPRVLSRLSASAEQVEKLGP